jgi:hypothetical protein
MSTRHGNDFIVAEEAPQQCDLCGAIEELRPYGPNGEAICFDCGMANREATDAAFRRATEGVTRVVVVPSDPNR